MGSAIVGPGMHVRGQTGAYSIPLMRGVIVVLNFKERHFESRSPERLQYAARP
jgi:hypothetical protein